MSKFANNRGFSSQEGGIINVPYSTEIWLVSVDQGSTV